MHRKSFETLQSPVARGLERVGERWSILTLRDASLGATRFDQFQKSVDITPNIVTRRLVASVGDGMLEQRRYSERPSRHQYVLPECGGDVRSVLWALFARGNPHLAPRGPSVMIVDATTGAVAAPVPVDRASLRPMKAPGFRTVPGPAATDHTRKRPAARAGAAVAPSTVTINRSAKRPAGGVHV